MRKLSQSRIDKAALDKSQNASGAEGSSSVSGVSPVKGASGSKQHAPAEKKTGHSKFYLKVSAHVCSLEGVSVIHRNSMRSSGQL